MTATDPKRTRLHYSYDESLDEAPRLIENEAVDVEDAVPCEENEPVEKGEPDSKPDAPAFEE